MPNLEQPPRGQIIKKGGKKVEAGDASGAVQAKPEELLVSESTEVKALKQQVKDLETQIEASEGDLKKDLEKELDEVQDKLAGELSDKYKAIPPAPLSQHERSMALAENTLEGVKKKQKAKRAALKEHLLPKIAGTKNIEEITQEEEQKGEVAAGLAEIKKMETERVKKVREEIKSAPERPAEETHFSNWPKPEEKSAKPPVEKPEEKSFTKTEEAWFEEGEQAEKSKEGSKKLEETAKKRSSVGLSKKVSSEEPAAVTEAKNHLEYLKKKLDTGGVDTDNITGGWINRMQIKLQFGGFFSKKGKEIGALYDAYVKAKKEVDEMTAPTGNAEKQMLRGLKQRSGRLPPGGPFGRP